MTTLLQTIKKVIGATGYYCTDNRVGTWHDDGVDVQKTFTFFRDETAGDIVLPPVTWEVEIHSTSYTDFQATLMPGTHSYVFQRVLQYTQEALRKAEELLKEGK
jgi:hypothetical protein